ncbi:MAG: EamA family transporter [Vicinamibacterales bacterium]
MSPRKQTTALLAWITVCLVWGTTYLAIRVGLESVPVALLAGSRWLIAGTILCLVLPLLGRPLPPRRAWGQIFLLGFLMNAMGNGLVVWAEQFVASGLTAVVVAMVPFWTVLVQAMVSGGERLTGRVLAGLALGFLGIVVLVWPELTRGGVEGQQFVYGVLALQVGGIGWALGTTYTKRHSVDADPFAASALQMLFAGLFLTAIGTALGEWRELTFTPRTGAAVLYLALVGSIVGYSCYAYALKYLPVSTVALYAYVNPIIAVALGTLILAEPFSLRIVAAAALVFGGIAVVRRSRSDRGIDGHEGSEGREGHEGVSPVTGSTTLSPPAPAASPGRQVV